MQGRQGGQRQHPVETTSFVETLKSKSKGRQRDAEHCFQKTIQNDWNKQRNKIIIKNTPTCIAMDFESANTIKASKPSLKSHDWVMKMGAGLSGS